MCKIENEQFFQTTYLYAHTICCKKKQGLPSPVTQTKLKLPMPLAK
jgi:hypothetical protein